LSRNEGERIEATNLVHNRRDSSSSEEEEDDGDD